MFTNVKYCLQLLAVLSAALLLFGYYKVYEENEAERADTQSTEQVEDPDKTHVKGHDRQGQSGTWVEHLLTEADIVWKAARTKQKEVLHNLAPHFRIDPWVIVSQSILWDLFAPVYHCPYPIERVGRIGDGGKWVCGFTHIAKTKSHCVVYSFGIANDISFEQEILERAPGCIVRMFDYTINVTHGPPADLVRAYPDRAGLHKTGLGGSNTDVLHTLRTEMELRGDKFVDILKVDVEGGEFNALRTIVRDFAPVVGQEQQVSSSTKSILPFGQLQIELHLTTPHIAPTKEGILGAFDHWYEMVENAGLRAFMCEPNQIPNVYIKTGYNELIEYSFLNRRVDIEYWQ